MALINGEMQYAGVKLQAYSPTYFTNFSKRGPDKDNLKLILEYTAFMLVISIFSAGCGPFDLKVVKKKTTLFSFSFSFLHNASVNSTCAQPPSSPGLTPGHYHFFCLGWQIPGSGDSSCRIPRGGEEKKRANAPSSVNTATFFH